MRRADRVRRVQRETALRASLTHAQVPAEFHDTILTEALPWYQPPRLVHLITPSLGLACGHDGEDDSSAVPGEVTCDACLHVLAGAREGAMRL